MSYRTLLVLVCSVVVVLLLGQIAYAQPYVDTGFNNQRAEDLDLIVVRENYNDSTFQQALYFRIYPLYRCVDYDMQLGGTITFSDGITISEVYYNRYEGEPANSDATWKIAGIDYSGELRGLEGDPIAWDSNTITFDCRFAHLDDFRVIIDYGDSFPDGAYVEISLLAKPCYYTGIQVGDINGFITGSGDYGETASLTVPLTPSHPSAKPPQRPDNPGLPGCMAEVEQLRSQALVPQTGQTTSHADYDDGYYEMGVICREPRFTDNGDGTVTDNCTGLIWLKNADRFGPQNWANALASCSGLADDGTDLKDGSQAGDWRTPNLRELQSLIDYGQQDPALPVGHPFINQQTYFYWSSTSQAGDPYNYAFLVYFNTGNVERYLKTNSIFYVTCVRDGN